jgi:hypothetical protein
MFDARARRTAREARALPQRIRSFASQSNALRSSLVRALPKNHGSLAFSRLYSPFGGKLFLRVKRESGQRGWRIENGEWKNGGNKYGKHSTANRVERGKQFNAESAFARTLRQTRWRTSNPRIEKTSNQK